MIEFKVDKKIDLTKIQKLPGEDLFLVGYLDSMQHEGSGMTMAQLGGMLSEGFVNSNGSAVPARPHLLEGMDYYMPVLKLAIVKFLKNKITNGKSDESELLHLLRIVIGMYVEEAHVTPNAPSTIARKGHDIPLIDTGELVYQGLVSLYFMGGRLIGS